MSDRKLATIEVISAIEPIPDADAIEVARIRNWNVVVKKGEFVPGDRVVYFEIDSMLPLDDPRFAFLAPRGNKSVDGKLVHVLKTAKFRGVYSQGLALDVFDFHWTHVDVGEDRDPAPEVGEDVSDLLGIAKYEPPIPADLAGTVLGTFDTMFCSKTDAERIQNIPADRWPEIQAENWFVTEKIDGSSCTFVNDDGRLRVFGRNWEYADTGNTMWRLAKELDIENLLWRGMAVQGEVFGEGIQSNPLKIKGQRFRAFSVWDQRQVMPMHKWPAELQAIAVQVYTTVPDPRECSIDELIALIDGIESLESPGRKAEGVVFHNIKGRRFDFLDNRSCFKVISNKYLLKADR